ncbi:hypothetical protein VTI74DRAFT_10065 [Chaetomium olivicolor]
MQSMQRQVGKLLNRGPGDNAKVLAILNDYEDVDKVLAQIIEDSKLWGHSWACLVTSQLQVVIEYEALYDPIAGASDGLARQAAPTPQLQLERTFRLKTAYTDLKAELTEELTTIETHVVRPATDARDCLAPMRRTIKKRENKRLDYERAQEKALKLQRKPGRNVKEDTALAKAETEMSRAAEEFAIADDHLRQTLPPLIKAAFSLVGPLLANLVLIQNRLLGLYYTILHGYCEESGFPSPPPPMEQVTAAFNAAFGPVKAEIESIGFIARGKATREPMGKGNDPSSRPTPPTNGARRVSGLISSGPQARMLRAPSVNSLPRPTPREDDDCTRAASPCAKPYHHTNATDFTTATILGGAAVHRPTNRRPSVSSSTSQGSGRLPSKTAINGTSGAKKANSEANGANGASGSSLAKMKRPPPPPPPKRTTSTAKQEEWVVAQYGFPGEGEGDLAFQPGDRIRVLKKTGTDQDWWVGELGGVKGNFPANYCKPL